MLKIIRIMFIIGLFCGTLTSLIMVPVTYFSHWNINGEILTGLDAIAGYWYLFTFLPIGTAIAIVVIGIICELVLPPLRDRTF